MKRVLLIALLVLTAPASANTAYATCTKWGGSSTYWRTLNIGRDAQVNQPVGPWIGLYQLYWRCQNMADTYPVTLNIATQVTVTDGNVSSGGTFNEGGQSYQLFLLNTGGQQVGYIARWRSRINASPYTDWQPVTQPVGTPQAGVAMPGVNSNADLYHVDIEVQARMVKTALTAPTANSTFNFAVVDATLVTQRLGGGSDDVQPEHPATLRARFDLVNATCTTPNVTVNLPEVSLAALPVIGSAGPSQPFDLRFENCPAGLHSIHWRAEAPGMQPVFDGTLPLDVDATARGVAVQVLHPDSVPVTFYDFQTLAAYNPNQQNATYLVPLHARVVRSSSVITPGSVQASMSIKVRYQ